MLDEELRDQLTDWARSAQRLPAPGMAVLRGRVRRRRTRAAGIAALAVGAAAGLAVALAQGVPLGPSAGTQHGHSELQSGRHRRGLHQSAGPRPGRHQLHHPARSRSASSYPVAWYPAGPLPPANAGPSAAPYFVSIRFQQDPSDVAITDWRTGATVGSVPAPAGGSGLESGSAAPAGFVGVAAAADDRTFVLADAGGQGSASYPGSLGLTGFYELRLAADGHPRPLTRLAVPAAIVAHATAFALSPDGSQLAVETASPAGITVVSLATGAVRRWHASEPWQLGAISFAGNNDLAVTWYTSASSDPSLRLVSVADSGSNLASTALIISRPIGFGGFTATGAAWDPLVDADGTEAFVVLAAGPEGARQAEIVQISLLTGQPVRAVLPATGESGMGTWCGALWSDPSGQRVAAECGAAQGVIADGQPSQQDLHAPMGGPTFPRQDFAW
jgi:hypothetical protein